MINKPYILLLESIVFVVWQSASKLQPEQGSGKADEKSLNLLNFQPELGSGWMVKGLRHFSSQNIVLSEWQSINIFPLYHYINYKYSNNKTNLF